MRYLTTTDPSAEAQEIEAPCGSAAVMESLGSSRGDRDHVTVYVRPPQSEWDVWSCVWRGAAWSATCLGPVQVADGEVDRLRVELREAREVRDRMRDYHDAETMRLRTEILAIGERVREACLAECRIVMERYGAAMPDGAEAAGDCIDAIAALDLDALSENAPSR
jgi:hypothetical protein